MKYKYKDTDDIIKKIVINEHQLDIYYFGNKKKTIYNYNQDDLNQIKQKMLEQAMERDKNEYQEDYDYNYENGEMFLNTVALGSIGGFTAFITNYLYNNQEDVTNINFINFGIISAFVIMLSIYIEKCKSLKKENDLAKYHLFLNNKELFDVYDIVAIDNLDKINYKQLDKTIEKIKSLL